MIGIPIHCLWESKIVQYIWKSELPTSDIKSNSKKGADKFIYWHKYLQHIIHIIILICIEFVWCQISNKEYQIFIFVICAFFFWSKKEIYCYYWHSIDLLQTTSFDLFIFSIAYLFSSSLSSSLIIIYFLLLLESLTLTFNFLNMKAEIINFRLFFFFNICILML